MRIKFRMLRSIYFWVKDKLASIIEDGMLQGVGIKTHFVLLSILVVELLFPFIWGVFVWDREMLRELIVVIPVTLFLLCIKGHDLLMFIRTDFKELWSRLWINYNLVSVGDKIRDADAVAAIYLCTVCLMIIYLGILPEVYDYLWEKFLLPF
jgi:hypothetical protein